MFASRGWRILVVVVMGACSSSSGGAGQAVGGPCARDADCQVGLTCETDDPGGQCTKNCGSGAECGAGNACVLPDPTSTQKQCYLACSSAADCTRAGYGCVGTAPATFCDVLSDGG